MDPFCPASATTAKASSFFDDYEKNLSLRSSDLLQNCDLPPPLNTFSPIHKDHNTSPPPNDTGLLRALQLSQTRAREAEKKAADEKTKNEHMVGILLKESLTLSAHQRWVKLLEAEISAIQKQQPQQCEQRPKGEEADLAAAAAWCLAVALCLGIAGVGFVLGRCTL